MGAKQELPSATLPEGIVPPAVNEIRAAREADLAAFLARCRNEEPFPGAEPFKDYDYQEFGEQEFHAFTEKLFQLTGGERREDYEMTFPLYDTTVGTVMRFGRDAKSGHSKVYITYTDNNGDAVRERVDYDDFGGNFCLGSNIPDGRPYWSYTLSNTTSHVYNASLIGGKPVLALCEKAFTLAQQSHPTSPTE